MLRGFESPEIWQLDHSDQCTLSYLAAKGGSMAPYPRTDYTYLIGIGYVERVPGDGQFIPERVALTRLGEKKHDDYMEKLVQTGRMFRD